MHNLVIIYYDIVHDFLNKMSRSLIGIIVYHSEK